VKSDRHRAPRGAGRRGAVAAAGHSGTVP